MSQTNTPPTRSRWPSRKTLLTVTAFVAFLALVSFGSQWACSIQIERMLDEAESATTAELELRGYTEVNVSDSGFRRFAPGEFCEDEFEFFVTATATNPNGDDVSIQSCVTGGYDAVIREAT